MDWPWNRNFPLTPAPELRLLREAWEFSRRRIAELRAALLTQPLPAELACVAVSGSLSRMEAHPDSDLDLLVVIDDRSAAVPQQRCEEVRMDIWQRLIAAATDAHITPPKPDGIFSQPVSWRALSDQKVRGVINEDMQNFGQRMQLLVDAQPVAADDRFADFQRDLLLWYSENRVASEFEEAGPFHWLWQDVQRYWRSIRSRACWLHADSPCKSLEVNLKLRSSRMVLIAAFLHSIASAQTNNQKQEDVLIDLQRRLTETPLERLCQAAGAGELRSKLAINYQHVWNRCRNLSAGSPQLSAIDRRALTQLRDAVIHSLQNSAGDWIL